MNEYRTKTGRILTDEDIQKLSDEAERGYDPKKLRPRGEAMTVAERKLSDHQLKILKVLKRKPHTSSETAELLNNDAKRRTGYAFGSKIHTYDSIHGALRRLEDREYVRRFPALGSGKTVWELTAKARDLF